MGIAVGMATNIPPHNLGEVIDGCIAYIDNHDITVTELMKHIKGPDFPTGGINLRYKVELKKLMKLVEVSITIRSKVELIENNNEKSNNCYRITLSSK